MMNIHIFGRKLWRKLILCLVIFSMPLSVCAKDTEAQKNDITNSINLRILENEPRTQLIDTFDVREDGWFVVGLNLQHICVYDENGTYQYGFRVDVNGDFVVGFIRENVAIFLERGDKTIVLDACGNCISITETAKIPRNTQKCIGNDTYVLERDVGFFAGNYARLVKTSQGMQTVLYDASSLGFARGIWDYVLILLFVSGVIVCIVSTIKKSERGQGEGSIVP